MLMHRLDMGTIQLEIQTREKLKSLKLVKGESYDEVITRLLEIKEKLK